MCPYFMFLLFIFFLFQLNMKLFYIYNLCFQLDTHLLSSMNMSQPNPFTMRAHYDRTADRRFVREMTR